MTAEWSRRDFAKCLASTLAASPLPLCGQPARQAGAAPIPISPTAISYLMADEAQRSDTLRICPLQAAQPPKRFWVEEWHDPAQYFEWKLDVLEPGDYEITLMVSLPPSTPVRIQGPRNSVTCENTWVSEGHRAYNWNRITLSAPLMFPRGQTSMRVQLEKPVGGKVGAALKSIELLNARERPAMNRRIDAFRSDTRWLAGAKFGFMCQCGEWSYPRQGPHKPWPEMVNDFDIPRFVSMVESTGAGYVVWSATWATYFFPAPIKAIDRILPGRTSRRDLIGEMADALGKRDIRLILYYHLGHDTAYDNGAWWSRNWVSENDKRLFVHNWCSIISEVGKRYGDRLAGWMFDDDLVYYPAPYERLGEAAKAGNSSRIISYNSWIQARGTDFQDFQFGEGFTGDDRLPVGGNGIWPDGPMKGLQAHGNFQVDGPNWGITHADTQVEAPHFTRDRAIQMALDAAARNEALSWNLLMYDDGTVSQASLSLLESVGAAVRAKYPRPKA